MLDQKELGSWLMLCLISAETENWNSEKLYCKLLVQGHPVNEEGESKHQVWWCAALTFAVSHRLFCQLGIYSKEAQRILKRAYFFCQCIEYSDSKGASCCKKRLLNRTFYVIGWCSTKTPNFKGCLFFRAKTASGRVSSTAKKRPLLLLSQSDISGRGPEGNVENSCLFEL